jgi:hypothetical protein
MVFDIPIIGSCAECLAPVGMYCGSIGSGVPPEHFWLHLSPRNGENLNCDSFIWDFTHEGRKLEVVPFQGWPPQLACKRSN